MKDYYPNNLFELLDLLEEQGVPKSEYWRHIGRFLENKSRRQHIPVHGNYELTPLCNFNCKMCYVHLSNSQFDSNNLLSIEKWKCLTESAYNAGMRIVSLTGGECLTYPYFDELYRYLILNRIKVYVMSNGYFIDEKYIKLFEKYRPELIQISVYGSSNDAYETVTGVRAFNKVYQNIVNIRDAGLPVKLAITPSSYMRDDVEPLIHLVDQLNLKYGINPQLIMPRKNTGRTKNDLSMDEYMKVYHLLSTIHHEDLKTVDWNEVPEENLGGLQRYGIRCGAGRSSFSIKYDGSMCPCISLDTITANPFEVGFEQAWKFINKAADEFPLPLECGDCIYCKHCLSCVAVHDSAPEPGHCDPAVCERTKRLVKEGFIPLKNIC